MYGDCCGKNQECRATDGAGWCLNMSLPHTRSKQNIKHNISTTACDNNMTISHTRNNVTIILC